jgi:large subunit ribosomal protein L30e
MAEKDELNEIKKLVKEGNIIIGTKDTLKRLKTGKLAKVWMSVNVPSDVKEDFVKYAAMNDVQLVSLSVPNDELGIICKKQFSVSVLSLAKGEK